MNPKLYILILSVFLGYAACNLVNLATLRDWPLLITNVGLIWDMVLTATTSVVKFGLRENGFKRCEFLCDRPNPRGRRFQ